MAIEYIEIRNANRAIIGLIDTAQSLIWHTIYYGVGDFEIYAAATQKHINFLQRGYYVTLPDREDIAVIEFINSVNDEIDGHMIIARGRFCKSMLDRRLIYNLSGHTNTPTILRGNVEAAARTLVAKNAITCTFDASRNFGILELGALANLPAVIRDENGVATQKQVSYQNLLDYSDELLQEYQYAARVILNSDNKKLQYVVFAGVDRSTDNASGNFPVIFSQDFENILSSDYTEDETEIKNVALIGGEGEDINRFYSLLKVGNTSGINRRETWVDANSINKTMKATDLQLLFPSGVFNGINFLVNNVIYAVLVLDLEKEYTLSSLQDDFPTGVVSGTKFKVNNVVYANKVYGDDNNYKLTALGYKAVIDKEGKEGDYLLTDAVYTTLLNAHGTQELAPQKIKISFKGVIDTTGQYVLNRDFFIGDIVTVQDNNLKKYANVRITEITEVQDENGYKCEAVYE